MQRISQFSVCLLAIVLIAAVAQCAVVCQTSPIAPAQAETKLPPCHKQSKSSLPGSDCSHPQNALLAAVSNLSFDWSAGPAFASPVTLRWFALDSLPLSPESVPVRVEPPLCLRV